jgi:hypothetical protein
MSKQQPLRRNYHQRRPVYWRRLAAAAHAALVVRVCGNGGIDPDEMISWAMRVCGETYFLSVVSDFAVEPQWRPEWIIPKILVADLFGRALAAWHGIPQDAATRRAGRLQAGWKFSRSLCQRQRPWMDLSPPSKC